MWLTCTLLVPGCFGPSDDAVGGGTQTEGDDDDASADGDGSTGMTTASDDDGPSDEQGDDPSDADPTTGDVDGSAGTDATDDGGSSDEAATPCDGTCVAVPPEGWSGPVTLASASDRPASCADATYDRVVSAGYAGVVADDASCDCDCGVDEAAVCDDVGILAFHAESDCSDLGTVIPVELGCNDIPNQDDAYWTWSPIPSGGSCEATAAVMVPPLGYTGQLAACGTDATAIGACEDDGECVPAPADDGALCWWAEGDVACPDALGGVREVIHTEDPIDTRGCETCTCEGVETSCDQPGIVLVGADETCDTAQVPPPIGLSSDGCQPAGDVQSVLWSAAGTPHTVCDPASDPAPIGAVAPQGAITVCCAG